MLDDDARRALEQEAIALVSLSTSQPLLMKKRPAPTAAEDVVAPKAPRLLRPQGSQPVVLSRPENTAVGAVYRPQNPETHGHLSMSVFVNADGKMSVVPHDKNRVDHSVAFDATKEDKAASPTSTTDSHVSMQSLLVTLKRKAEDSSDATSTSATKLPRFRDVFDPALKDRAAPPPLYTAPPTPALSILPPVPTQEHMAVEDSPFPVPPELKCKYRTGKCGNQRALKSCGDYHNLCNYHRLRANANQRKLDRKKKVQRNSTGSSSEATSPVGAPNVETAASTLTSLYMPRAAQPPSMATAARLPPFFVPPSMPLAPPASTSSSPSILRPKPEAKSC